MFLIWALGWLIFRGAFWFEPPGVNGYAVMVVAGSASAPRWMVR